MAPNYEFLTPVSEAIPANEQGVAFGPELKATYSKNVALSLANVESLADMFGASVSKFGSKPCLGKRTSTGYSWRTYEETGRDVAAVGSGFVARGVKPHGRVGVYGPNAPEWMITMQACNRQGFYCVPLYDSLGENAIEYILRHAEVSAVAVVGSKLPELAKALPALEGSVSTVVYWDDADAAAIEAVKALDIGIYSFAEFVALGGGAPAPEAPLTPDDLCTIMYTSGTTGTPKGVMLTHRAVIATVLSLKAFLDQVGLDMSSSDVMLSFLPLAHIFDRAAEELMLYVGGSIGYWGGNVKHLLDDVKELRPTLFCAVPRVFDRMYAAVHSKVENGSWLARLLFHHAFRTKLRRLKAGTAIPRAGGIWDAIVFKKIKAALGGQCRIIVSGGAPLSDTVEEFLRVAMCCVVVQGYGLTESCAASFIADPRDPRQMGTVGPPQPAVSMRLEGVPEMKYSPDGNPPRGELCLRGPALFTGYYKDPKQTEDVLKPDGWFYTGDVAELQPSGAIRIIDRRKNIFKLAQGEYIAVEKIEGVYKLTPGVEQVWVYGNSLESAIVAVVVPSEERVKAFKKSATAAEACADPAFNKQVLGELVAMGKAEKLKGFEQVKAIIMEPEHFTIENELLTPTFKLKRPQLTAKYKPQLDALYTQLKAK